MVLARMILGWFGLSYKHLQALKTNPLNNRHCSSAPAFGGHHAFSARFTGAAGLAGLVLLAGCSGFKLPDVPVPQFVTPYRMEIQQGNFITQEMISQLRPGMTRDQVRFVLGSPLVTDVFHGARWDYVFQRALENNRGFEQRKITVFFEDDKLTRIDGDVVPAGAAPAAGSSVAPAEGSDRGAEKK
jgi:outer membrane protein assembly factor BamE